MNEKGCSCEDIHIILTISNMFENMSVRVYEERRESERESAASPYTCDLNSLYASTRDPLASSNSQISYRPICGRRRIITSTDQNQVRGGYMA